MADGLIPLKDDPAEVSVLGSENAHFWLIQRMAKATGVDLVKAYEADILTQEEWAGLVTRCRGCQWAQGCSHWLDRPVDETRALPEPCLNNKRLAQIKAELEGMAL